MIYHSVSLIDEVRVYEMEKIKQKKKEIIKITIASLVVMPIMFIF